MYKILRLFLCLAMGAAFVIRPAEAAEWKYRKGTHFVVQYDAAISDNYAMDTLRGAEQYYDSLTRQIGYTRYHKFWTWDQRVKIILYADQQAYLKSTGLPAWSRGGATKYHRQLRSRAIVSFHQERDFLHNILPHEISHLILADFFGERPVPLWFNEGVAQLQEEGKLPDARRLMRKVVRLGYKIPFKALMRADIRFQPDPSFVMVFYAQSVTIIDFLIRQYGVRRFENLCRYMREGETFDRALTKAYTAIFASLDELEEKWLYYIQK